MERHRNEDKHRVPAEELADDYAPSALPLAPDGGLHGQPAGLPKMASFEDTSVCAQGPCRHYWHITRPIMEDVEGTYESLGVPMPKQHHHVCLVHPGTETEFHDDSVLACNRWDPLMPEELAEINERRERFRKQQENENAQE